MGNLEGQFFWEQAVEEPVELWVTPGAGDVEVRAGPRGKVRIEGRFSVRAVPQARAERLAQLLRESPPVEVRGREIRVGDLEKYAAKLAPSILGAFFEGVWIDYQIEVPPHTEARVESGSGDIGIQGISGPVIAHTGSGEVVLERIGGEADIKTGSGDAEVKGIEGELGITTGSGDVYVEEVGDDVKIKTGSGDVRVRGVAGDLQVTAGSGDLALRGISGDVEVRTGSGDIHLDSDLPSGKTWRLRTGSGDVELVLPRGTEFRLAAESEFGEVESDFPPSPQAASSVEVKAGSGDISIKAH